MNEREELDMISFWPQTNTEYDHIPYQPIQERAEEWQVLAFLPSERDQQSEDTLA